MIHSGRLNQTFCFFPFFVLTVNSRGEDGYFRVAQTEKGRYGLFGMLAEGVVVDATNVTAQVYDEEQDTPFNWWIILLIVLASLCCCGVFCAMFRKMRQEKKLGQEEK
jgi:hypothetical protein